MAFRDFAPKIKLVRSSLRFLNDLTGERDLGLAIFRPLRKSLKRSAKIEKLLLYNPSSNFT